MSENQTVTEENIPWDKLLDDYSQQTVFMQFIKSRQTSADDKITYPDIPWKIAEKEYLLRAVHVPLEDITKKVASKCKRCNSRGYLVMWVSKVKLTDPDNYIILSDAPFKTLSKEEQKIQTEKMKQSPTWKIALPCQCSMKGYLKSQMREKTSDVIMYTPNYNIVMKMSYEFIK